MTTDGYQQYGARPLVVTQVVDDQSFTARIGSLELPVINIIRRKGKRRHVQYTNTGIVTQPLGPIAPSITATGDLNAIYHPKAAENITVLSDMEDRDLPVRLSIAYNVQAISAPLLIGDGDIRQSTIVSRTKVRDLGLWEIDVFDIDETNWLLERAFRSKWSLKFVKR